MRISVVAMDTRGGVQPYTALALGLRAAGHEVRVLAPEDLVGAVRAFGLDAVPLSGSLAGTDGETEDGLDDGPVGVAEMPARQRLRFMREHTAASVRRWAPAVLDACAGTDLVTGGVGGGIVGRPVAERLGVPFLTAHLQPIGPPTGDFPGVLVPGVPRWLGAPGRRASHHLSRVGLALPFRAAEVAARTRLGLPTRAARAARTPEVPSVYGYSPLVVPPPGAWGPHRHVTGYWTLPAAPGWTPPPGLVDFLGAGAPPVCVGFGSMDSRDPAATTDLVLGAVRRAGVRAVLLSGRGGVGADVVGDDVLVLDEVPHEWLFPRVAAVVHHGGAGTTGAALRAGVPAVVVPFAVDQPFWGARVAALGVGPAPIPRRRLTARALGDALAATVTDEGMRGRAARLGEAVSAEDGVAAAVAVYDTLA